MVDGSRGAQYCRSDLLIRQTGAYTVATMQKSLVAVASALLIAAVLHAGEARAEARLLIDAESGKVLEGENAT